MKFVINTTSENYLQDEMEKLSKLGFKFVPKQGWSNIYYVKEEDQNDIVIELNDLYEFLRFVDEHDPVIIRKYSSKVYEIEIYDGYRE